MKMLPEIKKLWVENLRNGTYAQGLETLCSVDEQTDALTWCCVGVLTDVIRKAFKDNALYHSRQQEQNANLFECIGNLRLTWKDYGWEHKHLDLMVSPKNYDTMPKALWDSLFLKEDTDVSSLIPEQSTFWEMNDTEGKTFDEIADYIEDTL